MFERYTEITRRVLFFARYEASQFGDAEIGDTHLLLGLLREDKGLIYRLLSHPKARTSRVSDIDETVKDLREKVEEQIGPPRPGVSASVDMPISPAGKRILNYGAEEADNMGRRAVNSEHLLLGILREEGCLAASILANEGITLAIAREVIAGSPKVSEMAGSGGGISWGRGSRFPRTRALVNISILEFHCEGKLIASVVITAASPIPRVGERVTIRGKETQELSYLVEDVSYLYEGYRSDAPPDTHQLTKVVLRLKGETV